MRHANYALKMPGETLQTSFLTNLPKILENTHEKTSKPTQKLSNKGPVFPFAVCIHIISNASLIFVPQIITMVDLNKY